MKDKDKLILALNLYVGEVASEDIADYIEAYVKAMSGYFDDSVKVLIIPTRERIEPVIYAVTEAPDMIYREIEKIKKNVLDDDFTELKINALRLCELANECKKGNEISW